MPFKSLPLALSFFLPPLLACAVLLAAAPAEAQASATSNLEAYERAVTQPTALQKRAALQRFVSAAHDSSLRVDAVAMLAWLARQEGDTPDAERWARTLAEASPGHPLSLAVLADGDRRRGVPAFHVTPEVGTAALQRLPRLPRPEGMSAAEFQEMRIYVEKVLAGATGYAYLQRQQYAEARPLLRQAAKASPGDVQYAYGLAVADLSGPDPLASEGYWNLARTVDLTRGTPRGDEIAAYARHKYQADGGTSVDWDGFLMAAGKARAVEAAARQQDAALMKPAAKAVAPAQLAPERAGSNPSPVPSAPATGVMPPSQAANTAATQAAAAPPAQPSTGPVSGGTTAAATTPQTPSAPVEPAPAPASAAANTNITVAAAPSAAAAKAVPLGSEVLTAEQPSAPPRVQAAEAPQDNAAGAEATPAQSAPGRPSTMAATPAVPPSSTAPLQARPPANAPHYPTSGEEAVALPPSLPRIRPRQRVIAPGAPVSIGVLIETGLTTKDERRPVLSGLIDMARHLREYDEAFLLSFDRNIVFHQDLTSLSGLIEDGAKEIRPQPGTALIDAVTFAAFHMGRMAKNQKRVLLVVSDGENANRARQSGYPLDFSSEVARSGVEIYCIGVDVTQQDARSRLTQLAQMTGGQAVFVSDPRQVRTAAHDIAAKLGIWP